MCVNVVVKGRKRKEEEEEGEDEDEKEKRKRRGEKVAEVVEEEEPCLQ